MRLGNKGLHTARLTLANTLPLSNHIFSNCKIHNCPSPSPELEEPRSVYEKSAPECSMLQFVNSVNLTSVTGESKGVHSFGKPVVGSTVLALGPWTVSMQRLT